MPWDDEVDVVEHALRLGAAEPARPVRAEGVRFRSDGTIVLARHAWRPRRR